MHRYEPHTISHAPKVAPDSYPYALLKSNFCACSSSNGTRTRVYSAGAIAIPLTMVQPELLGVIEPRPRVQFPALIFDPHTDLRFLGTQENQIVTRIYNQWARGTIL